jgi:hypothetical protein
VKNYRQDAAQAVRRKGGRGAARPATKHNAAKAEAFESALARVSRQLGVVADRSAAELKDERLTRAAGDKKSSFSGAAGGKGKVISAGAERVDRTRKSSGRKKIEASTKAAGKRRQAKKDRR